MQPILLMVYFFCKVFYMELPECFQKWYVVGSAPTRYYYLHCIAKDH